MSQLGLQFEPPRQQSEDEHTSTIRIRENLVAVHHSRWPGWPLLNALKKIPGGKPVGDLDRTYPLASAKHILALEGRHPGVLVRPDVRSCLLREISSQERSSELSSAHDSNFDVAGLGGTLLPYQRAGVEYATRAKRCIIADDMGLGKTIEAIATLVALDARPAIVFCPASVKLNWALEIRSWAKGWTAEVVSGRKPEPLPDVDVIVANYELLTGKTIKKRTFRPDPRVLQFKEFDPKAVVFDECHRLKSYKTQCTKSAAFLSKKAEIRLGLSGTPLINSPVDLISQLRVLGLLELFGGWNGYTKRFCVQDYWGGFKKHGKNLEILNERMRSTCYIRRLKEDVLHELPEKRWATVALELTPAKMRKYDRLEKAFRKDPAGYTYASLRRDLAIMKLPVAIKWISDFIDDCGEKVVIFAHHVAVSEGLAEAFGADLIYGATKATDRQKFVERFQSDESCRVIVGNIKAAGEGITLTASSHVIFVELPWTPAAIDQAADRCHRIGQKNAVTAWRLIIPSTVDEDTLKLIETKRENLELGIEGAPDIQQLTKLMKERQ